MNGHTIFLPVIPGGAVEVDEGRSEGGQETFLSVVWDGGEVDEVGSYHCVPHLAEAVLVGQWKFYESWCVCEWNMFR